MLQTPNNVLTVGAKAHVAATYDEAHGVTIWVNGVSKANAAITGTWNQTFHENVTFAAEVLDWPGGTPTAGVFSPDMWIDSFRVSNVNRYNSAFTAPATKFASGANTLMLLNFDREFDKNVITRGYTNAQPAYLAARAVGNYASGGYVERLRMNRLEFILQSSYGPMLARSVLGSISDCQWISGARGAGPLYWDYSFENSFRDNYVQSGATSPWG
ncbi:MAG: LamG domain-containing protein, partial [Acidobacteriota bacterium]|nr:LamG domain-containing protein [Acidobacteriota bacterium]